MIIQCRKCETRFRFDENLMEGDGVWVRCSRCQHVFFQERPAGDFHAAELEIPSVRISDARRTPDDRFPAVEEGPIPTGVKAGIPLQPKIGAEQMPAVEFEKEPSLEGLEEDLGKEPLGGPAAGVEKEEEAAEGEEEATEGGAGEDTGSWIRPPSVPSSSSVPSTVTTVITTIHTSCCAALA